MTHQPITPAEADFAREKRIAELGQALAECVSREHRYALWLAMKAEIEARSIEQIMRMEQEKGIR